jgi:uncharacterized coiled-coil DUF342 family protein
MNTLGGAMQLTDLKTLENYDRLLETVQEIQLRLDRADADRIRLVNERVKLQKECSELRKQSEMLEESVQKLSAERDKLTAECDELRQKLEGANRRLKTLALANDVQKKN